MKKFLVSILTIFSVGSISALAFAAETEVTVAALDAISTIAFASALGIGVGVLGPAIAQGLTLLGTTAGISRNPEAAGSIRLCMLIGMAIMESLAIYALVVSLLLLYAFPFNSQLLKLIGG
ncbi:MAG: ATP synthase F0 subunit C [Deltaproteobacteria bacterium]|jgi:F-type H+-transporting ATPase subunit c|nr:ATP synthase F0 subunit C [Deltaproteobacteria bacterium]